jgi:tetratricopeptide (TPR) repeat protein
VRLTVLTLVASALPFLLGGCNTPLATGERLYRDGDRLAALETWRKIPEGSPAYARALDRTREVEEEFQQLVVRYKQRGRYFEDRERLSESILNYRLALKLQPDDSATLDSVQKLARRVRAEKQELRAQHRSNFESGALAKAGDQLARLRKVDPFDPVLESDDRELRTAVRESVSRLLASGRRQFSDGNHKAARTWFGRVLEIEPNNESARGYLSFIDAIRRESDRTGAQPAAFDPPAAYASEADVRAEGFYQNALAAERSGSLYGAIRLDVQALDARPNHPGALRQLAEIRGTLAGRVDSLIEAGRTQFKNEDLQSALDSWRRALLIDPNNERAKAYSARAERHLANLERLRSDPDTDSSKQ